MLKVMGIGTPQRVLIRIMIKSHSMRMRGQFSKCFTDTKSPDGEQ